MTQRWELEAGESLEDPKPDTLRYTTDKVNFSTQDCSPAPQHVM